MIQSIYDLSFFIFNFKIYNFSFDLENFNLMEISITNKDIKILNQRN